MRKVLSVSLLAILTLAFTQNVLVSPATAQTSTPTTMTKTEAKAAMKSKKAAAKSAMKAKKDSMMMSTPK
jgi:hypothetical protein